MIEELIVYKKVYDFLLWVKPTVQRFQKVHKFSLGVQLENSVLDLLKSIVRANNSKDKVEFVKGVWETRQAKIEAEKDVNESQTGTTKFVSDKKEIEEPIK